MGALVPQACDVLGCFVTWEIGGPRVALLCAPVFAALSSKLGVPLSPLRLVSCPGGMEGVLVGVRQEKSAGCSDPVRGVQAAGADLECPSGAHRP